MDRLRIKDYDLELYSAGMPHFSGNFTRDSIISAILMKNSKMLKDQLIFCSLNQGKNKNSITGEELGKIFHELPGVKIRNLNTLYNACDTTALYLIGHKFYYQFTKDNSLILNQKENIKRALEYILSHLRNGFFYEDPKFCDADKFALKVTYWKDSSIINRENGEPIYPVVYTLAHIENMAAVRFAAEILESKELLDIAEDMKSKALDLLFSNGFVIARDEKGDIKGITSDILHSLFYFELGDLNKEQLQKIIEASKKIETPFGYRVLDKKLSESVDDKYHSDSIWPFEQAIIHFGAIKFGLKDIKDVSFKIFNLLDTDPEIFILEGDGAKKGGCDPQLWTIAAKKYFKSIRE